MHPQQSPASKPTHPSPSPALAATPAPASAALSVAPAPPPEPVAQQVAVAPAPMPVNPAPASSAPSSPAPADMAESHDVSALPELPPDDNPDSDPEAEGKPAKPTVPPKIASAEPHGPTGIIVTTIFFMLLLSGLAVAVYLTSQPK